MPSAPPRCRCRVRRHVPGLHRLPPAAGHRPRDDNAYKRWQDATVVAQIGADRRSAFEEPDQAESPRTAEEQAKELSRPLEGLRRGFRPRLASRRRLPRVKDRRGRLHPQPARNEFIVIACGGGGIPVVRDYENKGCYKGVPAVIDKDLGGELLAEDCDADVLFLLTAVEHVAINFGKPNQEELEDLTADEAERLADEGQFGKGSMEPKVRAAIKFARSRKGRTCIIGALDKAAETMAGLSGTRIHE